MIKKNLLLILSIFFLLLPPSSFGNEFQEVIYKIKAGDSFASVLWNFVYPDSIINASTPMTKKTIESNPMIKNWNYLPEGRTITLYIDKKFLDTSKLLMYQNSLAPVSPPVLSKVSVDLDTNEDRTPWYKLFNASFEIGLKNEAIDDVSGVRKSETIKNEALHFKVGLENPTWSILEFSPYAFLGVGLPSSTEAPLDPSYELTIGARRYWEHFSGFGSSAELSFQKDSFVYFLNSTVANRVDLTASWLSISLYKNFKTEAFPVTVGGEVGHSVAVSLVRAGNISGVSGWREMLWVSAPLWDLGNIKFDYSQWDLSSTVYKLKSQAYKTSIGINF